MNDGKSTEQIFYEFQKLSKRHDCRYSDSVVSNLIASNFIFDVKVRFEGKKKKIPLCVEGEYFPKSSTNHGITFLDNFIDQTNSNFVCIDWIVKIRNFAFQCHRLEIIFTCNRP